MNRSPAQARAPFWPDGARASQGHAITVTDGDDEATFSCLPGETVLFAGQAAGWDLPYECASGGCGTCRAQLLSGHVTMRCPPVSGQGSNRISPGKERVNVGGTEKVQSGI